MRKLKTSDKRLLDFVRLLHHDDTEGKLTDEERRHLSDIFQDSGEEDKRADPNCLDIEKNETPLHLAVTLKKHFLLSELCRHGADVNLVDMDFKTPLDLVTEPRDFPTATQLIELRQPFNKSAFRDYLQRCVDRYVDRVEPIFTRQNYAMIAHYASRLTGCNICKLLKEHHNSERYVVHLYAFGDVLRDKIPLEGWRAEEFLPLRIYSFFEILVKLKKGIIKPPLDVPDLITITENLLEREILIACETLRTVQERLAIKRYYDTFSPEQRDDPETKKQTYGVLAKKILGRVSELKDGESYAVSIGFKTHEMYLTFLAHEGHILVRIDNLGFGCEYHYEEGESRSNEVAPFKLCSLPRESVSSDEELKQYLTDLLFLKDYKSVPKIKEDSDEEDRRKIKEKREELKKKIYETTTLEDKESFDDEWPQMQKSYKQTAGNCVLESQQVGLKLRIEDIRRDELLPWLEREERRCAVDSYRLEYIKGLSDKKYWSEEGLFGNVDSDLYSFVFQPFQINTTLKRLVEEWAILITQRPEVFDEYQEALKPIADALGFTPLDHLPTYESGSRINRLDDFHTKLLKAYEEGDVRTLDSSYRKFMNFQVNINGEEYGQRLSQINKIAISLFANVTEDVGEYEKQFNQLLPDDSKDCDHFFLAFIKGIVKLRYAITYSSVSYHTEARDFLQRISQDSLRQELKFFLNYALGINAYHLKKYEEAREYFYHAKSAIEFWRKRKRITSEQERAYWYQCLIRVGYIKLKLGETGEANDCFGQTLRVYNDEPFALLGIVCVNQLMSQQSESPENKIKYLREAQEILKGMRLPKDDGIRKLWEKKSKEINDALADLQKQAAADSESSDKDSDAEEDSSGASGFSDDDAAGESGDRSTHRSAGAGGGGAGAGSKGDEPLHAAAAVVARSRRYGRQRRDHDGADAAASAAAVPSGHYSSSDDDSSGHEAGGGGKRERRRKTRTERRRIPKRTTTRSSIALSRLLAARRRRYQRLQLQRKDLGPKRRRGNR